MTIIKVGETHDISFEHSWVNFLSFELFLMDYYIDYCILNLYYNKSHYWISNLFISLDVYVLGSAGLIYLVILLVINKMVVWYRTWKRERRRKAGGWITDSKKDPLTEEKEV
jgi:hypothetical protein